MCVNYTVRLFYITEVQRAIKGILIYHKWWAGGCVHTFHFDAFHLSFYIPYLKLVLKWFVVGASVLSC